MATTRKLELVFTAEDGANKVIYVNYPAESLSADDAEAAAAAIITANAFETSGGDLVEFVEARYRVTSVETLL